MRLSIITVVYNSKDLLPGTVESVLRQTWPDIEYILVDGGSNDGTLELIRQYAAQTPYIKWVSGKDKGLYDAMNKGLAMATGAFVQFLNSGDWLHAPDTVEQIMLKATPDTGVLYGDTLLVNASRDPAGLMSELSTRPLPEALHWTQYLGGMLVVHQSFIARRSLAPEYALGNLCADYEWCIEILKKSGENIHTGIIITDYLMGGMSKQRHRQSLKDRFKVMRRQFGWMPALLSHLWIVLRAAVHYFRRWGRTRY